MLSSRRLLPGLIVAATALFVVGVSIERNTKDEHAEPAAASKHTADEETHSEREAGTHSEADEAHGESTETEQSGHTAEGEESSERLLGIDPESTPLIVLAAISSLGLALAVLRWPSATPLLWMVAVAMGAFAALDLREVLHQIDENREGLAVLAGVVAVLHALAAGLTMSRDPRVPAA